MTAQPDPTPLMIRALTLRQPWASLIALGFKRMETRSWDTQVRGPVAIHAGAGMPCRIGETFDVGPFTIERDSRTGLLLRGADLAWPYRLSVGAVVAVVDLFQTRPTSSPEHAPSPLERALGDHSPGRYAWSLASVSPILRAMPATGHQGFWTWDPPPAFNPATLRYPEVLS